MRVGGAPDGEEDRVRDPAVGPGDGILELPGAGAVHLHRERLDVLARARAPLELHVDEAEARRTLLEDRAHVVEARSAAELRRDLACLDLVADDRAAVAGGRGDRRAGLEELVVL